jgi:drug/metabolite transporter (DMT)-like permease
VALGAALWGTETLWRVFLNKLFPADVLVFLEHGYCVLFTLPILWWHRHRLASIAPRAWWFLLGSGLIGSALGTFCFTESLRTVNLTVANVLLNIQPVFTAFYARWLLKEHFGKGFFGWSFVAISAGILLSLESLSLENLKTEGHLGWVLATAACWSFATVAGRGANTGMSFWVASPLRFVIGLVGMGLLVVLNGHATSESFNLGAFEQWQTHQDFLLLSILAGVLPLFLYFRGLSSTPASVGSFLEMFQILAALVVTWGFFGDALAPHQIAGGLLLMVAVFQINQIQSRCQPA